MSTATVETRPSAPNRRGGRGGASQSRNRGAPGGGRRRNNANARAQGSSTVNPSTNPGSATALDGQVAAMTLENTPGAVVGSEVPVGEEEVELCLICTEPVKFYSVAECNHRTCHVCAVRLRALYKKMECTFCKVSWRRFELFGNTAPSILSPVRIILARTRQGHFHNLTGSTLRRLHSEYGPFCR